jgi:hypothetical protein
MRPVKKRQEVVSIICHLGARETDFCVLVSAAI